MYIIVHVPGTEGSYIFKTYTPYEAQFIPGFLGLMLGDGAEVVITNVPDMFPEYAPCTRIRDKMEFVNTVLGLVTSNNDK